MTTLRMAVQTAPVKLQIKVRAARRQVKVVTCPVAPLRPEVTPRLERLRRLRQQTLAPVELATQQVAQQVVRQAARVRVAVRPAPARAAANPKY